MIKCELRANFCFVRNTMEESKTVLRKGRWIKEGLFFQVIIFTLIKTLKITQKNAIQPAITCSKLTTCSIVFIVNFEHVIADREVALKD